MGAQGRVGSLRVSIVAINVLLVGMLTPAVAGASTGASSAVAELSSALASTATATKLSIAVSASEVDAATGVTVRGKRVGGCRCMRVSTTSPCIPWWRGRRPMRPATNAAGDYSFNQQPTWSTVYQTRFAGGPNRAATSSSYKDVRVRGWYYLTDLPHTDTYGDGAPTTGGGTYRIGGVAYPHSLSAAGLHLDAGYEWDQVSACSRFDTKYGVDDKGHSTASHFQALWDKLPGTTGMSPVMSATKGGKAKFYLTAINTHHLTLIASGESTDSTQGDAVWASARVHCIW